MRVRNEVGRERDYEGEEHLRYRERGGSDRRKGKKKTHVEKGGEGEIIMGCRER